MSIITAISWYLFFGVVYNVLYDLLHDLFAKHGILPSQEDLGWTWSDKLMSVLLWPYCALLFIRAFIKSLFK